MINFNSIQDKINGIELSLKNRREELEKNKANGKSQIILRDKSISELNNKISQKDNIEKEKNLFFKELEDNFIIQSNLNSLIASCSEEKNKLKDLNQFNRTNRNAKSFH